jgi:hypothetical protein
MEADQILNQWKAERTAKARKLLLEDCDTEGLALVLLASILRINEIPVDGSLFKSEQPSPTARAALTFELYGQPEAEGQSQEIQECWQEAYRQEWTFATGDGREQHGTQADAEEMLFGVDPAELTNAQLESRERLAAKLTDRGQTHKAAQVLAMQGDRITFSNPEADKRKPKPRSRGTRPATDADIPAPQKRAAYSVN